MDNNLIYKLNPQITQKGEIKIIGVEELFVNLLSVDSNEGVPIVYHKLSEMINKIKREQLDVIKYMPSESITIGVQRHGVKAKVNMPRFDWPEGKDFDFYHMAGIEVNAYFDILDGMTKKTIPPSNYAIFSCEASANSDTGKLYAEVNVDAVFDAYLEFQKKGQYKEKDYYLEISHYSDEIMTKYELWIPVKEIE